MREAAVTVLRSTAELEDFEPRWRELWEADPQASPFQHPAWLIPWWHQFAQPELRVLVLERDSEAVGVVPLYIYEEPESGERKLMPVGVGTTDYLDGVFRPECGVEDIRLAVEELAEDDGWDALYVPQLRAGSRLAEALAGMPEAQEFESDACSQMPAVAIAELPTKLRRNVMYYRNRAAREGELTLEFADGAALGSMFDELVPQHTTRWEQVGEPGVLADPRVLAWHWEALPQLQAAGLLRLCSLRRNGEALAVIYALADPVFRAERSLYVYITSYAVEHAEVRPGTVLLAMATEQAAEEGIRTIDMLRGDEGYKRLWHMAQVSTRGFRVEHPEVAGAMAA